MFETQVLFAIYFIVFCKLRHWPDETTGFGGGMTRVKEIIITEYFNTFRLILS